MKNPKWFCSTCRQPFTRRWNANRHCNNKHSSYLEHIISFSDYLINRQDSNPVNNFSKENKGYQRNFQKNQLFFDTPISSKNSTWNCNTDPLENYIEQELLPYEVLSPLAPKYEELRRIFDHVPEPSKNRLLGNVLLSAINSDNPVETMQKQVIEYRKSKNTIMMFNDLAKVQGGNVEFTKQFLKFKAKQKNKNY